MSRQGQQIQLSPQRRSRSRSNQKVSFLTQPLLQRKSPSKKDQPSTLSSLRSRQLLQPFLHTSVKRNRNTKNMQPTQLANTQQPLPPQAAAVESPPNPKPSPLKKIRQSSMKQNLSQQSNSRKTTRTMNDQILKMIQGKIYPLNRQRMLNLRMKQALTDEVMNTNKSKKRKKTIASDNDYDNYIPEKQLKSNKSIAIMAETMAKSNKKIQQQSRRRQHKRKNQQQDNYLNKQTSTTKVGSDGDDGDGQRFNSPSLKLLNITATNASNMAPQKLLIPSIHSHNDNSNHTTQRSTRKNSSVNLPATHHPKSQQQKCVTITGLPKNVDNDGDQDVDENKQNYQRRKKESQQLPSLQQPLKNMKKSATHDNKVYSSHTGDGNFAILKQTIKQKAFSKLQQIQKTAAKLRNSQQLPCVNNSRMKSGQGQGQMQGQGQATFPSSSFSPSLSKVVDSNGIGGSQYVASSGNGANGSDPSYQNGLKTGNSSKQGSSKLKKLALSQRSAPKLNFATEQKQFQKQIKVYEGLQNKVQGYLYSERKKLKQKHLKKVKVGGRTMSSLGGMTVLKIEETKRDIVNTIKQKEKAKQSQIEKQTCGNRTSMASIEEDSISALKEDEPKNNLNQNQYTSNEQPQHKNQQFSSSSAQIKNNHQQKKNNKIVIPQSQNRDNSNSIGNIHLPKINPYPNSNPQRILSQANSSSPTNHLKLLLNTLKKASKFSTGNCTNMGGVGENTQQCIISGDGSMDYKAKFSPIGTPKKYKQVRLDQDQNDVDNYNNKGNGKKVTHGQDDCQKFSSLIAKSKRKPIQFNQYDYQEKSKNLIDKEMLSDIVKEMLDEKKNQMKIKLNKKKMTHIRS